MVASSWEYDPCSRASLFSVLWLSCNLKFVVTEMLSEHCWNFLWSVQALIRGLRPPQTPYNVHCWCRLVIILLEVQLRWHFSVSHLSTYKAVAPWTFRSGLSHDFTWFPVPRPQMSFWLNHMVFHWLLKSLAHITEIHTATWERSEMERERGRARKE